MAGCVKAARFFLKFSGQDTNTSQLIPIIQADFIYRINYTMIRHCIMTEKYIILFKNDLYMRQSFALILERAGYNIISTGSAKEALESIKSTKYQLVISDMDIPDTRSILIPKIKAMPDSIQAIILTDHTIADLNQARQFSNIHYLEKPVAPERLLSFVGEVMGQED